MKQTQSGNHLTVDLEQKGNVLVLNLAGDFHQFEAAPKAHEIIHKIRQVHPQKLIVQDNGIGSWDSSLLALLYQLLQALQPTNITVETDALPQELSHLLTLAFSVDRHPKRPSVKDFGFLGNIGNACLNLYQPIRQGVSFLKQVGFSLGRWAQGKAIMRPVDFWFALQDCGPNALGIVALISFMVGLILAFVGAIQLKSFGAQIYVASLVAIGMTRIMGAIMVGIIMAGRTGASYAATIGTMQVNEELDALQTMGIPRSDFLVLPRVLALSLTMPLLTLLADVMGMIGGGVVGIFMLDISPSEYWKYSMDAFDITNFLVGVFHGLVFGIIIALCGCYYGVFCGRSADSVGRATTQAVVSAIVWMIVMTGLITWGCEALDI